MDENALRQRLEEVCGEIRAYPGPIARCDQHLPALLEERRRLQEALAILRECMVRLP